MCRHKTIRASLALIGGKDGYRPFCLPVVIYAAANSCWCHVGQNRREMVDADRNDYLVTGNLYDSTCQWTGTCHPVTRSARHCRSTGLSWFLEGNRLLVPAECAWPRDICV